MKTKPFDLLDKEYELVYVDYRSNFDDQPEALEKAIHKQEYFPLEEENENWIFESSLEGLDYVLGNFKERLIAEREVDSEVAERYIIMYGEEITDEIYNRDCSNPVEVMLRYTSDPICFINLGYEVTGSYNDEDEKENIRQVKYALGIKMRDKTYDRTIRNLLQEASYGGFLAIHFRYDADKLINLGDANTITFKNPMVTVYDLWNGSGNNEEFIGLEVTLPSDIEKIRLEKNISWNYTYKICGMHENWCDCTQVSFSKKRMRINK